ncbi:unnamed protein product, partial [Adineta ricciae]
VGYSKVLVHRQTINPYRTEGGTGGKAYITVMLCGSATGFLLPPFIIYKSKRLFQEWCTGGPTDAGYSNSDNGWIDQQLFYEWFDQVFLKHTKDLPRPLVLIVDGHGSHFKVETLKLAVENQVIILCLPSNATHILQPLDLVFFNPLKIEWRKILKDEYKRTHDKTINKARFPTLLNQLWQTDAINRKTNLIKSFMRAGVFPLNKQAIDVSRILKSSTSNTTSSATTDLHQNDITNTTLPYSRTQPVGLSTLLVSGHSSSTHFYASSFATSQRAILTLNQVLDDTTLNNNDSRDNNEDNMVLDEDIDGFHDKNDDDDDDDDDDDNDDNDHDDSDESYTPESSSKALGKRKRSPSETIRIDTSDDDDTQVSTSYRKTSNSTTAQTSSKKSKGNSKESSSESMAKRKRVEFKLIGSDISDEEDILPERSQDSLTPIKDTLQTLFGSSSQAQETGSTKRTMLKRHNGKIMTENDVIDQLEEQQRKKKEKKPRTTYRKTNRK